MPSVASIPVTIRTLFQKNRGGGGGVDPPRSRVKGWPIVKSLVQQRSKTRHFILRLVHNDWGINETIFVIESSQNSNSSLSENSSPFGVAQNSGVAIVYISVEHISGFHCCNRRLGQKSCS